MRRGISQHSRPESLLSGCLPFQYMQFTHVCSDFASAWTKSSHYFVLMLPLHSFMFHMRMLCFLWPFYPSLTDSMTSSWNRNDKLPFLSICSLKRYLKPANNSTKGIPVDKDFFFRIVFVSERGNRGRKKGRKTLMQKRNINWLPLACAPTCLGTEPTTKAFALTRIKLRTFSFGELHPTN